MRSGQLIEELVDDERVNVNVLYRIVNRSSVCRYRDRKSLAILKSKILMVYDINLNVRRFERQCHLGPAREKRMKQWTSSSSVQEQRNTIVEESRTMKARSRKLYHDNKELTG